MRGDDPDKIGPVNTCNYVLIGQRPEILAGVRTGSGYDANRVRNVDRFVRRARPMSDRDQASPRRFAWMSDKAPGPLPVRSPSRHRQRAGPSIVVSLHPHSGWPQVAPRRGALKRLCGRWCYPLCPAPSIDGADGIKRADCLSPPQAGEFPRAPAAATTHRVKRDTGGFFWLLFFSRERKVTT